MNTALNWFTSPATGPQPGQQPASSSWVLYDQDVDDHIQSEYEQNKDSQEEFCMAENKSNEYSQRESTSKP